MEYVNMVKKICLVLTLCIASGGLIGAEKDKTPRPEDILSNGCKALIQRQHDDGSWGGDEVKNQDTHKSDYPVAISSLGYLALMSAAPDNVEATKAREKALEFILSTIKDDGKMKNTRDNTPKVHERNVWSQGFSLFVFSRLLNHKSVSAEFKKRIKAKSECMISALSKTQLRTGGWTYAQGLGDTMLTGTILMGIASIKKAGVHVPGKLLEKAIEFVKLYRAPGTYVSYSARSRPMRPRKEIGDSLCRSVLLELSLIEAGVGDKKKLTVAVETFMKHRKRLDDIRDREQGCHQPPYGIATFYCFYGYYYMAHALETVEDKVKEKFRPVLDKHFKDLQKPDGHWLDSKDHTGPSYGTAMGLLVLTAPEWSDSPKASDSK